MAKTRRRSKRSWMQEDRYWIGFNHGAYTVSFNMAETFERMGKSKRWKHALLAGVDAYRLEMRHDPKFRVTMIHERNGYARHCDKIMTRILNNTMDCRGVRRHATGPVYSVHSGNRGYGGRSYGASVSTHPNADLNNGIKSVAHKMVTILHELAHYVHLCTVYPNVVKGVERCHDRMFNAIMCEMARHFWGYDRTPMTAGYSIGRGYAPTEHLTVWITDRLTKEFDDKEIPRLMDWIEWQ
jgi:hypothetical protein